MVISKELIIDNLDKLTSKQQTMIKLYYGIDCEKLTYAEIGEIVGKHAVSVSSSIKKIIKIINGEIENSDLFFEKANELKQLKKEKKALEKEETIDRIKKNIYKLDTETQDIVRLYYGIGCEKLTYAEIAKRYFCSLSLISLKIEKVPKLIEEADIVLNNLDKLDPKQQEIIKLYYGIGCKKYTQYEIAESLNISLTTVVRKIDSIKKIINGEIEVKDKTIVVRNIDRFNYERKKAIKNMDKLDPEQQDIVKLYYGIDCEKLNQSVIAEYFGCSVITIARKMKKIKDILGDNVNNKDLNNSNNEDQKVINFVLNHLSELTVDEQEIIKLYYGIGCKKYSYIEISELKKCSLSSIINKIKEIKNIINEEIIDIDKNKVIENLNKLNYEQQDIAILYYGINCNKLTPMEIAKCFDCSRSTIIRKINKIRDILFNSKDLDDNIHIEDQKMINDIFNHFSELMDYEQEIIKLYYGIGCKRCSYTEISKLKNCSLLSIINEIKSIKDKINRCNQKEKQQNITNKYKKNINRLNIEQQEIIKLYYGIDCNKLTYSKIEKRTGIPLGTLFKKITKAKKILNGEIIEIDRDETIKYLHRLDLEQQDIAILFYGINCKRQSAEEIRIIKGYSFWTIWNKINTIRKIIKGEYNIDKDESKSFIECKDLINRIINNFGRLNFEQQELIKLYYGIEYNKHSKYQIADLKKCSIKAISKKIDFIHKIINMNDEEYIEYIKKSKKRNYQEKTLELFERIYDGDSEAKNEIVKLNERLIYNIVNNYFKNVQYEDKYELCLIGFAKAINTYDPSRGILFSTYATKCMNNEILMFLKENKKHQNVVSLENEIGNFEGCTLLETLPLDYDLEEEVMDKENIILSKELFEISSRVLNDREKEFIRLYYGIGCESISHHEIANRYNLTTSTVSKTLQTAYKKMKVAIQLEVLRKKIYTKKIR